MGLFGRPSAETLDRLRDSVIVDASPFPQPITPRDALHRFFKPERFEFCAADEVLVEDFAEFAASSAAAEVEPFAAADHSVPARFGDVLPETSPLSISLDVLSSDDELNITASPIRSRALRPILADSGTYNGTVVIDDSSAAALQIHFEVDPTARVAELLTVAAARIKTVSPAAFRVIARHFAFGPLRDREPGSLFPPPATRQRRKPRLSPVDPPERPPSLEKVPLEERLRWLLTPPIHEILSDPALSLPEDPYPFQGIGVKWLIDRDSGLLADEMGLGKTMQAILAARLLWRERKVSQILVVCPKPLISNWQREIKWWWPGITPYTRLVEGDRRWILKLASDIVAIKIVNYEALSHDLEWLKESEVHHDLVIIDEAQRIKNPASKTSQAVKALKATRRWALTGTPIENSVDDLISLFGFVRPGLLKAGDSQEHVKRAVRPFMLRRRQEEVRPDLPDKIEQEVEVELGPRQRAAYNVAETAGKVELTAKGETVSITHVLQLITRLRQICNFDPISGESAKADLLAEELEEIVASGRKALVFSQFVDERSGLKKLAAALRSAGALGKRGSTSMLTGETAHRQRQSVLDQFQADPDQHVLLMNYRVGSVGLNIQKANYVFLFDRWWNPAVEDQAIKRSHRMGQTQVVIAKKFYCRDTIEERILKKLAEKRRVFNEIIDDEKPSASALGMTEEEVFALFGLKAPARRKPGTRLSPRVFLENLDPRRFEDLVASVYEGEGYSVKLTPISRDGGIDIIAEREAAGGKDRIVIQCKHQKAVVGRPVLQQLWGVLNSDARYTRADLVTSSRFSADAISFAKDKRINLVDRGQLEQRAKRVGVAEFVDLPR